MFVLSLSVSTWELLSGWNYINQPDGNSKSPRHLVVDTGTKSRGTKRWEVTIVIEEWGVLSAIYLLRKTTYHCYFMEAFNPITHSFLSNVKPVYHKHMNV